MRLLTGVVLVCFLILMAESVRADGVVDIDCRNAVTPCVNLMSACDCGNVTPLTVDTVGEQVLPSGGRVPYTTVVAERGKCSNSAEVTVIDACKKEATGTITFAPRPSLSLASVSGGYSASGGVSPYRYDISCGTIDATTGEVSTVCCKNGTLTVTVTDDCGATASIENTCEGPRIVSPSAGATVSNTPGTTAVTISGGRPPYTATFSHGTVAAPLTNKFALTITQCAGRMHVPVEGSFAVEDADGSLATLQLKIQSGIWVFDHEETRRFNTKNDCPASSFGHDFFEASVLNGTDSLIHIPVAIWAAPSCVIEGTTVSSLGTPVSISDSEGLTAYVFGPPNGGYEVINYFVPGCP